MTSVTIGSLNCRGLVDEKKRRDFFVRCRDKYDITFLTDTHCSKEKECQWQHEWGYKVHFSSHSSNSRGVAILLKNTFSYEIHKEIKDDNGNFIILDITIQDYRMTLVALYGPNSDCPGFFSDLELKIQDINNSSIIMGGDWNVVQDFNLDTCNYKSKNNIKANDKLQEIKKELDLVDIWRDCNPEIRRYTWRGPELKQSRLDYFLISTDFESFVKKVDIDLSYRSDHSPVYLVLQFCNQTRGRGTWKFNNSLLYDKEYIKQVKSCIQETVTQYRIDNSDGEDIQLNLDPNTFWELLKCMIRGVTISYSSFVKKENQKEEKVLNEKLAVLQNQYNHNPGIDLENEIKDTENMLKSLREKRVSGIMARAKARWAAEGEKCTNYFCNLEKRNYTEKIIPKLITDDGEELFDQFQILNEQKAYYEKLYTSCNPEIKEEHEKLFFDKNNPFLNFLTDDETSGLEGTLSKSECLNVLKNMKNGKSPGLDGYTIEFYKFFWNDINLFLIKSLNYSLEKGIMSISQRQGVITCLPKEGKSKFYLKNWRPITLLNVDTKIASACMANRIKPILNRIISETQVGFLKGRYIGECTRLIFDILEKSEEEEIPGLLILLDFEKAFDSLEWSFIDRTLSFFGFGEYFRRCVCTLYSDAQSCIINNGHCSDLFKVGRGVRQGDPLSPYLFILSLELMSAAMKFDPEISGIKIDNSEFLLSQYADDSSLILDDNEHSLEKSVYILEKFSECAGLRANFDKTEAIWIGSKKHSTEVLLPEKPLKWNQSGKFKLLGIKYDIFAEDKTVINFEEKKTKMTALLKSWSYRNLTYIGKITVIKSLALPIIIQSLTVLPNPPKIFLTEVQNMFYNFVWSGKPDKIKRNVLINNYEDGGLRMPHLESFCLSLKMTWINKLLDPLNNSPWKILISEQYNRYGGDKIWMMSSEGLMKISSSFNKFWADIIKNWAFLSSKSSDNEQNVLDQSIWFNNSIKIDNKIIFFEKWCKAGLFFINDLIDDNQQFLTRERLNDTFNIRCNFLTFNSLLHAIPKQWKDLIPLTTKKDEIMSDNFLLVKRNSKCSQPFYKKIILFYSESASKQQTKWNAILDVEIEDWPIIYEQPFKSIVSNKLIIFQYKILHRTLGTNSLLYKCKLKETHLCTFCNEIKETISHIFWECNIIKSFWFEVNQFFMNLCHFQLPLSAQNVLIGSPLCTRSEICIFIILKYYIYTCKMNYSQPMVIGAVNMLKNVYNIEKMSFAFFNSPAVGEKRLKKWDCIKQALV